MSSNPVPLPPAEELNVGLNPLDPATLQAVLGKPREAPLPPHQPGGPCFEVTNPLMDAFMVTRNVGPFRVTGLQPAIDLLADVMDAIKQRDPALHARLGTAGMLCVRRIAGSTRTSNHAWGTAVDIKVDNILNIIGNGMSLPELQQIAPIFNEHGWFWGAEFPDAQEDSMHFEIAQETFLRWKSTGVFQRDPILQRGHIGTRVLELQRLLNRSGVPQPPLALDRVFGENTEKAVLAFQRGHGLDDDGVVGKNTWHALRA